MAEEVGVAFVRLVPSMRGFAETAQREMERELHGPARRAGEDAGREIARGMDEGLQRGAQGAGEDAAREVGQGLDNAQGPAAESGGAVAGKFGAALKAGIAGAALAVGAVLTAALSEALDQSVIVGRLGAQLGKTPEEARRYGKMAGHLYANAITEDFQGAADAISATMRSGLLPPDATNAQIESISTKVSDLATTFDQDLGGVTNAVSQMLRTGLAKSADEAFDVLTKGFQSSANKADDLVDTFNEYGTQFRKAGLDGADAVGLMNQAIQAGARDSDLAADAIKEFSIRAVDGSKTTADGFKMLGLSADDMAKKFGKGGKSARDALDETLDRLRAIKDPVQQSQAAVALFGTQAEDLGQALLAMDPSTAVDSLGKVAGAADKMGDALRDNAGVKVEQFKRRLQEGVVSFLGNTVIPAVDGFRTYISQRLSGMWDQAGKGGTEGVDRMLAFVGLFKDRLVEKMKDIGPKIIEGLFTAGEKVAAYISANPEKVFKLTVIASALMVAIAALPAIVAAALTASAALMMWGFVKGLISSLLDNIPKWWAAFTQWVGAKAAEVGTVLNILGTAIGRWFGSLWTTYISGPASRTWNSLLADLRALPGRAVAALSSLGTQLAMASASAYQRFRDAANTKVNSFLAWMRGLPGRISSSIGSLGSLLYSKGQSLVTGLYSGVRSMGGWLRNQLMAFARSQIPGPIAKALGIASPSKLMAKAVGRWIPAGIAQGWQSGMNALTGMAGTTADAVMPTLPAATAAGRAGAAGGPTVVIDGTGLPRALVEWLRGAIRTQAGGSAERFFQAPA